MPDEKTIKKVRKIVAKSSNCKKLYAVIESSDWDIGRNSAINRLTSLAKQGNKHAEETLIYAAQHAPYAVDRCNAAYAVFVSTTGNADLAKEAMSKSISEALENSKKSNRTEWLELADDNAIQEIIKNRKISKELRDCLYCERLTDIQAIREAASNKNLHGAVRYELIRSKLPETEWVNYVTSLGWDKLYLLIEDYPPLAKEVLLEAEESFPDKIWESYSREAAPADYVIMAEQAKAPLVKATAAISALMQCPGRYGEKLYDILKNALDHPYFPDIKEVITAEAEAGGFTREQCIDFITLLADDLEKDRSWKSRIDNSYLLKRLYKCLSSENDEKIEKIFTQIKNKSYSRTHSDRACYPSSDDDDLHNYDDFTFDPSE